MYLAGVRAIIYARISDDRAGQGLGVARQEADCRALCERAGHDVVDVLVDNDRSAFSGKRRPAYERLLERLRAAEVDVVVAWHPDRLHRAPIELETFIDVLEAVGAKAVTVMAGHWDLSTASGRVSARIVGVVARGESEHKADRQRRKALELAQKGLPNGSGTRAFGFRPGNVELDPVEAEMIRQAVRDVLDGASVRSIAARWQAMGHPTPRAGQLSHPTAWTSVVVKKILTSPRIAGLRQHQGPDGATYPAVWSAIVDEVTWRRARTVLRDPSRTTSHAARRYLLTGGVARCGIEGCGAKLVARPRADKRRCYVCATGPNFSGCGGIRVLADPLEQHVVERLIVKLADLDLPDVVDGPGVELLALEETEAALVEIAEDYYVNRSVDRAAFDANTTRLRARLTQLQTVAAAREREAAARRLVGDPADLAERWVGLDLARQRAIVERYVDAVVVSPAVRGRSYFDGSRVEIKWR